MPLTRRKKILLSGGILLAVILMLVVYYMMAPATPRTTPKPFDGAADPEPTDTSFIPPPPPYASVGDSTADGTPVDGTGSGAVPVSDVATTTSSGSTSTITPGAQEPAAEAAVVVDCTTQQTAMIEYYKLKTKTLLSVSPIAFNSVDSATCDAGFQLTEPGTTIVKSVDSRRFTFDKSGIIAMGVAGSGATITLPKILAPITTVVDAPPTALITDYGAYFKKIAGSIWNTSQSYRSTQPSLAGCQKLCYDSTSCTGVNYNTATGGCTIVQNTGNPVMSASPGSDFYQRIPTKTVVPVYSAQIPAGDTTNYLANYTPTAGKYYVTGDITSYNTNTAMICAAGCEQDYTCSGFNWWQPTYKCEHVRGYTGQPLNSHAGAVFYKRNVLGVAPAPAAPAPVETDYTLAYNKYPDRYYAGGAPTTVYEITANQCAKRCDADANCRGYTWWSGNRCEFPTQTGRIESIPSAPAGWMNYYEKKAQPLPTSTSTTTTPTFSPTAPLYKSTIAAGDTTNYLADFTSLVGSYLNAVTATTPHAFVNNANECAALCARKFSCSGFTVWPESNVCRIHDFHNNFDLAPNSKAIFYNKKSLDRSRDDPNQLTGYTEQIDQTGGGELIGGGMFPSECAAVCNSRPCYGFTWSKIDGRCDISPKDMALNVRPVGSGGNLSFYKKI